MSDTQVLLDRITTLRHRLENARTPAGGAGGTTATLSERLDRLKEHYTRSTTNDSFLEQAVRQVAGPGAPEARTLPRQLTARARNLLSQGRDILAQLRSLADNPLLQDDNDPLAALYRETAAIATSALRLVQGFPDAPAAQLQLCDGLEGVLRLTAQRVALLASSVERRVLQHSRVENLAGLLLYLHAGKLLDVQPLVTLAADLWAEAQQGTPLVLPHDLPQQPARFVASHCLAVAQVLARLLRHDPDLRAKPLEPILAALIHDVGMLSVPVEILAQPSSLDDGQRRLVEGHTRIGADLARQLLPRGTWLAEAVQSHHERLDGSGYPDGLRELQIPALPRLLAVCDVYASLSVPRAHRPALDTRTALTDTLLLAERGQLDRQHAERLLHLTFYPTGTAVELADGAIGVVVATHQNRCDLQAQARPVVAVLLDEEGRPLPTPQVIDLAVCEGRSIVRSIPAAERPQVLGRWHPEWI